MGGLAAKFYHQRPVKVVLVGLDAAGKTTLLYRYVLGELVQTIPTMGVNMEEFKFNGSKILMMDMGLRDKARVLLRHYIPGSDALVYVIDSTDRDRMAELREELLLGMLDAFEGTDLPAILFLANKQDLPNAMTNDEITETLRIREIPNIKPNRWHIMGCSVVDDVGLTEAMTWVTNTVAGKYAYDDVTHHVGNAKSVLITDHREKISQGWNYCLCGLERAKQWWRSSGGETETEPSVNGSGK